jgi:hypothetical protein
MDGVRGVFGDPNARIVTFVRRSKKRRLARAEENMPDDTIASFIGLGTFREVQSPKCLDQIGMILLPEEQLIDAIVTPRAALRGLVGEPNELGLATQSARHGPWLPF